MSNCKREKRGARSLTRARARALPAPPHPPAAGRARARRSLARLAGLDDFSGLAKPVLFARLKEHNLDRLTRVRNRGLKRHASWADVAGGHGDALADGDAVMGSACSAGARLAARAPDALDGAKRPACGKGKRRRAAISQPEVLDPILLTELGPHKARARARAKPPPVPARLSRVCRAR